MKYNLEKKHLILTTCQPSMLINEIMEQFRCSCQELVYSLLLYNIISYITQIMLEELYMIQTLKNYPDNLLVELSLRPTFYPETELFE